MSDRFVILSGCSSGGKSTLLAELARRGYATIEEPGRRIVREQQERGGNALPWVDAEAFCRRAIEISLADREEAAGRPGWVFFDRGLVDAMSALEDLTGKPILSSVGREVRYHRTVFLAPPWPAIYVNDDERKHSLDEAVIEYVRLVRDYGRLGYEIVELPRSPVADRADFVLERLSSP